MLENCEKRWIVNRLLDKNVEKTILELLHKHNQPYIHLPFCEEAYRTIGWDTDCLPVPGYLAGDEYKGLDSEHRERLTLAMYRLKNNYVMNNNGARNVALRDGKPRAKWILPWDGNCFVTHSAWKEIRTSVAASPHFKYFAVPMTRVIDNQQLLENSFVPNPVEEPQLIFRTDSAAEFNEKFCYGHRPKVELLWHLGIPGKWDDWEDDPWDQARRPPTIPARQYGVAGWTARLYSGMQELELDTHESFTQRGIARRRAIISTLRQLDLTVSGQPAESQSLSMDRINVLNEE